MLAAGASLGPYKIVGALGAGGMGEVYRAHDTRLGCDVAIKVLAAQLSASPEVRARFEREARAISQLNHPHICTLHDIGHQEGIDYLVMELLDGETLAHRLEKGPLPVAEVLRYGIEIAGPLDVAHRHGIVHRDLKPGNVMLTKSGAKLMDFGLARPMGLAPVSGTLTESPTVIRALTAEGTIVGTFQYIAPEQLEGKEADARSDIWAMDRILRGVRAPEIVEDPCRGRRSRLAVRGRSRRGRGRRLGRRRRHRLLADAGGPTLQRSGGRGHAATGHGLGRNPPPDRAPHAMVPPRRGSLSVRGATTCGPGPGGASGSRGSEVHRRRHRSSRVGSQREVPGYPRRDVGWSTSRTRRDRGRSS